MIERLKAKLRSSRWRARVRLLAPSLPRGLYWRSILIIVVPMVVLQAVVAVVFMERHYNQITTRLSDALTSTITGLESVYNAYPQDEGFEIISRDVARSFRLNVTIVKDAKLPPPAPKPFFSELDRAMARQLADKLDRPFWIDTVGNSDLMEIRIQLKDGNVMRIYADRRQAVPSNTHIFLVWMVGTALVLIVVSILFLRNQIKPILALANAAEAFGMGREVKNFRPRGAREVRRASIAFMQMRDRLERQIEQRTTMLSGVSHDLRTVLTRFKLQLALLPEGTETDELHADINEMQRMLEEYLDFARGDAGEEIQSVAPLPLMQRLAENGRKWGLDVALTTPESLPELRGKPIALERCFGNVVHNASRFGKQLNITVERQAQKVRFLFDDDGPGIHPKDYEQVFKAFHRLDDARNQDTPGSGLGLSIVRDIVRSHGGMIKLDQSPEGGLRVEILLPLAQIS
jgi:two-component system osmolarity sensor histidine kinase EnvZ